MPSRQPGKERAISPHMTGAEVRAAVVDVTTGNSAVKRARSAELAWRPAWAIRSRRGALQSLIDWIARRQSR